MATFVFVPHHRRVEAVELARKEIERLVAAGHRVVVPEADARITGLTDWAVSSLDGMTPDLGVCLGGDGTMLRTIDLVCPTRAPVLGVNIGHLGYLTETDPTQLSSALERFLANDYKIDERMTLEVMVTSAPEEAETLSTISLSREIAVNEIVVEKSSGHTVRLGVSISGREFLTYAVDGMIVATPTGSTAYNLSARGPIVSPALKAMLMTPVSPHMLFDRSMVLGPEETVELRVIGTRDAAVVVDGRHLATIAPGGVVTCKGSDRPARLVVFDDRDFRNVLKVKFGLTDR